MSAWLPLLSACDLQCLTPLFFASCFSLGSFIALEGQSLKYSVNMLTTCILYYCAAAGPGCLINCCKLCCFLSRKLNEVQYQFINSRCIYSSYCFVYILYRLLNKQLRQLLRKRSLSESRSYHISINKQHFCEQNNCCLPLLCHVICVTRNKYYTMSLQKRNSPFGRRQFSSIDLFLFHNSVIYYEANIKLN